MVTAAPRILVAPGIAPLASECFGRAEVQQRLCKIWFSGYRLPSLALCQLEPVWRVCCAEVVLSTTVGLYFLGLRFDTGSIEEAVCGIVAESGGDFKYVVTPNVHHVVKILDDPATVRTLYERAWRVFCDSRVLSRLAWFTGQSLPVVTGSDLTAQLIERAAELGLKIAVIGPTVSACAALTAKHPGLDVVVHTLPMGFIKSEHEIRRCVEFVVENQASLVFLAVGMPQQEILASHIADHPQARGVGLCIGASIDFLTGKQQRAPVWVQKAGLEWLHRLLNDPRRLASRYLIECPRIFYLMFLTRRRAYSRPR